MKVSGPASHTNCNNKPTKPENQRSCGAKVTTVKISGDVNLWRYNEEKTFGTSPKKLWSYGVKEAAEDLFGGEKLRSYGEAEAVGIEPEKVRSYGGREVAKELLGGGNLRSYGEEGAAGIRQGATGTACERRKPRNQEGVAKGGPGTRQKRENLGTKHPKNHRGRMGSQRASHRKGLGAEGGGLAPIILASVFGENEDVMEIESPAQSLKKLLEEKAKTQPRGPGYPKRAREITQSSPNAESASLHRAKIKFWLGFETI